MLYPEHLLGGASYLSSEVQSVYSTAPADWAIMAMWEDIKNWYVTLTNQSNISHLFAHC